MADATAVIKAGNSPASSVVRRKLFAERYLVNGRNGTEAAQHAGATGPNAATQAGRWLKHPDVIAIIAERTAAVIEQAVLNTDRWAKEMASIGHFDPGELYDDDGHLIPLHLLPEHVRRAVASVKTEHRTVGRGEDREVITTQEVKLNDKNTALANIGRHLGAFDKDNAQKIVAIQVNIQLVG